MRPLLIIQTGDLAEESPSYHKRFGGYYEIFNRIGCMDGLPSNLALASEGAPLPPHNKVSAALITGSNAMIRESHGWSEKCAEWLREAVPTGLPVLGVCYGHQLIAHALGGTIGLNPGGPEYGSVEIELLPEAAEDPLLRGAPKPLYLQQYHADSVTKLPEGARLLAQNHRGGVQAVRYAANCWGVQFHPEFAFEDMHFFLTDPDEGLEELGIDTKQLVSQLRETPFGFTLLKRFRDLVLNK